jgi:pimeloyl-ACP methyl ester carboxylesterase
MERREIVADGHRLEALLVPARDPERPTLVLLHEGLGSVSLWRDLPQRLAGRTGCAVLAYSRWGHGASDPLTGPRGIRYMHDEALRALPQVLAAFGIVRPVLIGHSDGASIALIHAGEGGGDVRGLVLMAPHVFVEDLTVESIARIGRDFAAGDMATRMGRHHRDPVGVFRGWNDIWLHPDFRAWNIEAGLGRIACPALLIQGADDEYGTLAQLDAIEAGLAGPVERLVLTNCGHAPQKDQPEAVLDAIARFVAGL